MDRVISLAGIVAAVAAALAAQAGRLSPIVAGICILLGTVAAAVQRSLVGVEKPTTMTWLGLGSAVFAALGSAKASELLGRHVADWAMVLAAGLGAGMAALGGKLNAEPED